MTYYGEERSKDGDPECKLELRFSVGEPGKVSLRRWVLANTRRRCGDESQKIIWGNSKEVKEPDVGGCLSSRESKQTEG